MQFQDFKPFESNFATLLVRPRKSHPSPNIGHLIIKKAFGHITECHAEAVTTIDLDLRDPDSIGKDCFFFLDLDLDFFLQFLSYNFFRKNPISQS